MSEMLRILAVGLVVFTTFTLEGISGFGSTVLALPFIIMLLGIDQAVPLLSTLGWLLAMFIIVRSRHKIDLKEYRFIALNVALGVPAGLFLSSKLPEKPLIALLVAVMFFVGIRGVATQFRPALTAGNKPAEHSWLMRAILFCGGIIHGAFSSGGPVIIIYASKALPDKSLFRVTLSLLWLTTNSIMLATWTIRGDVWTAEIGKSLLCALPFVSAGIIFGDCLHHQVNQRVFRILVYSVLCAAATVLLCCRVL